MCLLSLISQFSRSHVPSVSTLSGFQPLPAPTSGDDDHDDEPTTSSAQELIQPPLSPPVYSYHGGSFSGESAPPSPAVMGEWHDGSAGAPAQISENGVGGDGDGNAGEIAPSARATDDGGVWWCAVRDEVEECESFVSLINQLTGYTWKW